MTRFVEGDLFDPNWHFDAIGHGVNCQGRMGAGIAPVFKAKWPLMYDRYASLCKYAFLLPGQVYPFKDHDTDLWIYNIASQYHPGANAEYTYLKAGLEYVRFHMLEKDIKSLGLPWIGAGIGGLDKDGVASVVSGVFAGTDLQVTIVSLPE